MTARKKENPQGHQASMNGNKVIYANIGKLKMTKVDASYIRELANRWYKLMYNSTNPNIYWNGKDQNDNSPVADGVYYYILKYTCSGKSYNKYRLMQVIR